MHIFFQCNKYVFLTIALFVGYNSTAQGDALSTVIKDTVLAQRANNSFSTSLSDTISIDEIIVQGPLISRELIRIPSNIIRLNSTKIETDGAIGIVEKLNQVPGIYAHTGALNTNRITIRGIGSRTPYSTNRIKAYWNGIPISQGDGTTNIDDFDPWHINKIEIIRGTKSALYGMGLGGVLLISSHHSVQKGLHGAIGGELGVFGTYKPYLELGYASDNTRLLINYSANNTNGWRQNSAYNRDNLGAAFSIASKNIEVDFHFNLVDLRAEIPSSLNENTFKTSPESAASNWLAVNGREEYKKAISGIKVYSMLSSRVSNSTILFYSAYSGEEYRPFNILIDEGIQYGIRSVFEFTYGRLRLNSGLELLQNKYSWKTFKTNNGQKGEPIQSYTEKRLPNSVFLQTSYPVFKRSNIEFGISYNNLRYALKNDFSDTLSEATGYSYDPVLSPFLGFNIPIGKIFYLYSSVAHGFSAPTVEETLLPEGIPNSELKPECGWNFELGSRILSLDKKLFIDATIYWMLIKDLLLTKRISEEIFYGDNAGRTSHLGFELQARYKHHFYEEIIIRSIDANLSYAANNHKFVDFNDDGVNFNGNYLPGIPRQNLLFGIKFSFDRNVFFAYSFAFHDRQFLNDGNTESYSGYSFSNVRIGADLFVSSLQRINLYFGVKNILNRNYASMILVNAPSFGGALPRYYYPGLPRYFYGGVRVNF
jgi:iron complex outermembrane receptor protein